MIKDYTSSDKYARYLPANMSADVFPKAKNVTPAMFCERPSVFEIINRAGQRKSVAVTPVATNRVSSQRICGRVTLVRSVSPTCTCFLSFEDRTYRYK